MIAAAAVVAVFLLYEYRSDKVTGQSEHAARAWPLIHRGMTEDAVTKLAGKPSVRHGSCWAWGEGWVFDAQTVFRVCFNDGRVARKSSSYSSD